MINRILISISLLLSLAISAQIKVDSFSQADAKKYLNYLASDKMEGRVNFTKKQLQVAGYLSNEFRSFGLTPFPQYSNYFQPFYTKEKEKLSPYLTTDTVHMDTLYNIVGIIPGKNKPDEAIIFSAHYDHVDINLGFTKTGEVFNGANDNASGTTAVLMLAKYFSLRKDNERTLVFCLFAGEEMGLLGSEAFSRQVEADKVSAVINIEMIGRYNRSGKGKFFITGSKKSTLEYVFKSNLINSTVSIEPEGDDITNLFKRSDNFSFAKKGIVSHSIMCSDDYEDCYHNPCDDVNRIDLNHMTKVIRGIAQACKTLIDGSDTPEWK
ncbi:MAG: M28 family peptidase [Bacteroidetes bacterium]|nr:M28 family peptidase [Bacteroidota bacterium]